MILRRTIVILAAATAIAGLAACGPATTAAPAPAGPAASAPAATTPAAGGGGAGCGANPTTVKQALNSSDVTSVTIDGGCSDVTIKTSLSNDKTSTAQDLCEAAAKVAYVGQTSSVTVIGASGKEMAIGLASAPCIGEP